MELVIILAVVAVGVWYFFFRDKELVKEATTEAPYKVEDRPHVIDLVGMAVLDKAPSTAVPETKEVTTEAPVEVGKSADDRVEATAPVAKPAKPKRVTKPKVAEVAVKPKTTPKPKAATKPRAKAPKMTVAK
jgi:outer membrane biosynthesis protein TonB